MKRIFLLITLCMVLVGCREEVSLSDKIVFLAGGMGTGKILTICIMNADGREKKILMERVSMRGDISLSPDGKKIAFVIPKPRQENTSIYLLDIETGDQKRLTDDQFINIMPCWSPDNKKIAFISNRDGNHEIYTIDIEGLTTKRLTNDPNHRKFIGNDSWSPDGKKIAFEKMFIEESYTNLPGWEQIGLKEGHLTPPGTKTTEYPKIYLISPDGSEELLTDNFLETYGSKWSPDDKKILFTGKNIKNEYKKFMLDITKNSLEKLPDKIEGKVIWSPDGRKIVFVNYAKNSIIFYVMDVETKAFKQIAKLKGMVHPASFIIWTPDGEKLIFSLV
ncbi:MAG: DPP IV N-terminal domain-containing protein, partial [Candidatus Desantisbacteria bacterium]